MPIPIRLGRQPIDTGKIKTYFTKTTTDGFPDTYLMHKWDLTIVREPLKLSSTTYTFPQVKGIIHPQTVTDMPSLWSELVKHGHLPPSSPPILGRNPIWDIVKNVVTFDPPLILTFPMLQMTCYGYLNSIIDNGAFKTWKPAAKSPVWIPPQPGHTYRDADINSYI